MVKRERVTVAVDPILMAYARKRAAETGNDVAGVLRHLMWEGFRHVSSADERAALMDELESASDGRRS